MPSSAWCKYPPAEPEDTYLDCAIGDHLVSVHVGLCAGARLKHDQRKFAVPTAVDHLLRGTHDQVDFFPGKLAQLPVGKGGAFLQDAESADHRTAPAETFDPDREVDAGPLGLRTPQMICRNLNVS
jgi:hypothetical protein